jgi:hypothetical protein
MSRIMELGMELVVEVAKGNPGALSVIKELAWFSRWFEIMTWCKDNLSGHLLWGKYKDEFHCNAINLGRWIETQIEARDARAEAKDDTAEDMKIV